MRFKSGQEVYLKFYDHVQDSDEEITCEVWGRVVKVTKLSLVVACWDLVTVDEETRKENQRRFTIVRSTIIDSREIR